MKNAIALGTFDGVHIGHREVLNLPLGYKRIAVTFSQPPKLEGRYEGNLLMLPCEKEKTLKLLGIDNIYCLQFEMVKDINSLDFLKSLKEKFSPALISCGFNYRFGKDGKGDTALLKEFCEENNIELKITDEVKFNGITVSSTRIRKLINNGEISLANKLLGRNFSFETQVIHGDKRGRTLGFPTINQKYPKELVNLRFGVYKSKVCVGGKEYDGITNIGKRPTFSTDYIISETHIKNFYGEIYGENVRVELLDFIRDEARFASIEELKKQIDKDIMETEKKG